MLTFIPLSLDYSILIELFFIFEQIAGSNNNTAFIFRYKFNQKYLTFMKFIRKSAIERKMSIPFTIK